tara:strand:- start:1329 stop:2792 length:1464 start_codon:yes stop_codon:yes gene_type:complete
MKFIPRSFNKTRKKMTYKMNKTQKAARDKAKNAQKSAVSKLTTSKETMGFINKLFNKITQESAKAINSDLMLKTFMKKNKTLLPLAFRLLHMSYTKSPPTKYTGKKSTFDKKKAVKYSKWANNIYSSKDDWKKFISGKGSIIRYQDKQHLPGGFLVPKYSVVEQNGKIIVTFKGTSTGNDALIDLLANTESFTLDKNKYYAHAGFLRAATMANSQIGKIITEKIINKEITEVIVTGHSLGGGVAHMFGILFFNSLLKVKTHDTPGFKGVKIFGYAPGTTVTSKNKPPLTDFLKKHNKKCKIVSFINDQDIVPRLSMENGVILLAVCASIANEIFLNKDNKEIFREELKKVNIYNALNTIVKSGELKDKAMTSIKRTKNRFRGGSPDFWSIIKDIRDKTTTLYSSIKKLQISPPINTQPIGDLNLFNGESFFKVNKLDFPIIKKKSLTDHGMNGYIGALKKFIPVLQKGGKTKRRRRKKKRKTKKKYN